MHIDYPKLPPWWQAPWLNDSAMDGRMREADLEDNINDHATADDASYSMREHDDGDDVGALAARADALAVELREADAADATIADASIADVATAAAATQAPASTVVALRARAADAAAAAADAATAAAAASDALADENPVGCDAPGADQGMDVDGRTGHEECASARPNEGAGLASLLVAVGDLRKRRIESSESRLGVQTDWRRRRCATTATQWMLWRRGYSCDSSWTKRRPSPSAKLKLELRRRRLGLQTAPVPRFLSPLMF